MYASPRTLAALAALALAGCGEGSAGADTGGDPGGGGAGGGGPTVACDGCTLFRHVGVLDDRGAQADRRVGVRDGRIAFVEPDDDTVFTGTTASYDGRGKTLLPGLWDSHVHLGVGPGRGGDDAVATRLKGLLRAGVTSAFDLGTDRAVIAAVRDRVAAGELLGPRLRIVGPLVTVPGSHPCPFEPNDALCEPYLGVDYAEEVVESVSAVRPDALKLVIEGGLFFDVVRIFPEEVVAIADAARARGLPVVPPASTAQPRGPGRAAVGPSPAPPPRPSPREWSQDQVAAADLPVITTLAVNESMLRYEAGIDYLDDPLVVASVPAGVRASLADPGARAAFLARAADEALPFSQAYLASSSANAASLRRRGVPLLAGSDAGNFSVFHGEGLHRELELLVAAGLDPTDAVAAATRAPALAFGVEDELGRVEPGLVADLVLAGGDVASDIRATRLVEVVMLGGVALDLAALDAATGPDALVRSRVAGALGAWCLDAADCAAGLGCNGSIERCQAPCDPGDPGSCPEGEACLGGFCFASSGCEPLRQDCPRSSIYKTSCVPVEEDFTSCVPGGPRRVGEPCDGSDFDARCTRGAICEDGVCKALCDPAGQALAPCASGACRDRSGAWGHAVGVCE